MRFESTTCLMPSLSFHIRSQRDQGEAMLYCRCRFRGELTTEYKVWVKVPREIWPDLPPQHPQSAIIKLQLALIRADHQWIAQNLPDATADAIKQAWRQAQLARIVPAKPDPKSIAPLLTETYWTYLKFIQTPPRRNAVNWKRPARKTIVNRESVGKRLEAFLKKTGQSALRLDALKVSFGYQFADYLTDEGLNADTVARHICYLRQAVDHAVRYDYIPANPIASVKIKGKPAKRITFLTQTDLDKLATLELTGIRDTVRQWALLMCYTGLDYHDALAVTKDPNRYRVLVMPEHQEPVSEKWVYQRLKYDHAPQWGECHIPILPETRQLLSTIGQWKRPRLKVINTHLKELGEKLQLPFPLCSKICRKTAGAVFMRKGATLEAVQKILGHQSYKTTERHYANLPGEVVNRQLKQLMTPANPTKDVAPITAKPAFQLNYILKTR